MSLAYTPHFRGLTFELSLHLNHLDHKKMALAWLESGHLQNGITLLNLKSDDRLKTLISILKRGFKRGIKIILSKSSGSQADGVYTVKEDKLIVDVANMLDLAVGKYMSDHPEEVQKPEVRDRHLKIAAKIFVEIFYEVSTGSDGGFTTAFLSNDLLALAVQVPQEKPASKETQRALDALTLEFEALLKKKDDEIRKLRAETSPIEQLRRANANAEESIKDLTSRNRSLADSLKSKNKEIEKLESQVDEAGKNTMRAQVARAQSALKEAKSEIYELKESLAREKGKNNIAEAE
ncbi:hypothetical protein MBLNU13_g10951t1 [Cladosporium sp. NU13]